MRYVSTRGGAPVLAFDDVLLAGLAQDGGLYVPETWPALTRREWATLGGRPYSDVALAVLTPYVGSTIAPDALRSMVEDCYRGFSHPAVAPLKQLGPNDWLLELFHGPTIAFKDYALQLVGRLFDHVLARRAERITIVGATSGDTGSAAIEACRDRAAIDIFILHPHGRVSDVQRRQMTTVPSANVHNIAIEGTFDDCQDLVKAMFADAPFRDTMRLSAVNSINWVRVAAQIVYYATSALALGAPHRGVSFCVPTGNFGNVFAAYAARRMGLPIERLVIASNRNDILTRTIETGTMTMAAVEPSLSPSMDIQVSSNFERLLFELTGRDGAAVAASLGEFRRTGSVCLPQGAQGVLRDIFDGGRADDATTLATIAATARTTGEVVDPHTAVALHVASLNRGDRAVPMVTLATAHPAKFPDAVARASGHRPELPARLAGLMERPERMTVLPNDLTAVENFVRAHARIGT